MKKVTVVYDSFACVADIDVPLPTNSESGLEANRLCYAIKWLERLAGRWFVYPWPIKAISIEEVDV